MKVDLSLVLSVAALAAALFGALAAYLSAIRLKGTIYDASHRRVELDQTREALEVDFRRMYDEIYRDKGRWAELNHLLVDSVTSKGEAGVKTSSAASAEGFLQSMGVDPSAEIEPKLVFVLTPLNDQENGTYDIVRQVCSDVGLHVRRGDELRILGPILPHILHEILRSWLVIANINGRNPNVFYELGIAQALGKPCLLIAKAEETIPFDVSHQQLIFYKDDADLRERLNQAVSRVAIGDFGRQAPRNYFSEPVMQDAILVLRNAEQGMEALRELQQMPGYIAASLAANSPAVYVKGRSNSKQFITDVGEYLKDKGILVGSSTLVYYPDEPGAEV